MVQLSHKIDDPTRSGKLYTEKVCFGTDGRRLVWMLISAAHNVVGSGLRASAAQESPSLGDTPEPSGSALPLCDSANKKPQCI